MKHHITPEGIVFVIIIICTILIGTLGANKLRLSMEFDTACNRANGIKVTEFVCVRPGSIFDPTIGN